MATEYGIVHPEIKSLKQIKVGDLFYVTNEKGEGFDVYLKISRTNEDYKGSYDDEQDAYDSIKKWQKEVFFVKDYHSIQFERMNRNYKIMIGIIITTFISILCYFKFIK